MAEIKYRGVVVPDQIVPSVEQNDYQFVHQQKMGYHFSYESEDLGFHVVDRFASFPLFYVMNDKRPVISEMIEDLLPYLSNIELDPIGYYTTGGPFKGERSDRTPFKGIKRIPPGHYLEYKDGQINLHCYWAFTQLKGKEFKGSYEDACEELGYLIRQGVERCYQHAPETALHLSGGIDSGTITAIVCQLSNRERLSYALIGEDAPLIDDIYESGFIQKYKNHFPHLRVNYLNPKAGLDKELNLMPGAGNWYDIEESNIQDQICKQVKSLNKGHILTGLGGDELASYGHGFQNVGYSLKNDKDAKEYMKWKLGKLQRNHARISALLGRTANRVDSLRSIRLSKVTNQKNDVYSEVFKKAAAEWMNKAQMAIYWYPSSYDYRLEILGRSYFTIRSDKWNFIGRQHGVNYLHPLLDADLVDFSASLPRNFFRNRKQRELIKTALKKQLPNDLLKGGKRPDFFSENIIKRSVLLQKIKVSSSKLVEAKKTYASTVFDYNKIETRLQDFQKLINKIPESHQQTMRLVNLQIVKATHLLHKGKYLNKYFG